jgi:hypothetical protein
MMAIRLSIQTGDEAHPASGLLQFGSAFPASALAFRHCCRCAVVTSVRDCHFQVRGRATLPIFSIHGSGTSGNAGSL